MHLVIMKSNQTISLSSKEEIPNTNSNGPTLYVESIKAISEWTRYCLTRNGAFLTFAQRMAQ